MAKQQVRRVVAEVIDDQAKNQIIAVARESTALGLPAGQYFTYDGYEQECRNWVQQGVGVAIVLVVLVGVIVIMAMSDGAPPEKAVGTGFFFLILIAAAAAIWVAGLSADILNMSLRRAGQLTCPYPNCRRVNFSNEPWICEACGKENGFVKDRDFVSTTWIGGCRHCRWKPAFLRCCHCAGQIPLTAEAAAGNSQSTLRGAHKVGFVLPEPMVAPVDLMQVAYERIVNESVARQRLSEMQVQVDLNEIITSEIAFNEAMSKVTADPQYHALPKESQNRIKESARRALLARLKQAERRRERQT